MRMRSPACLLRFATTGRREVAWFTVLVIRVVVTTQHRRRNVRERVKHIKVDGVSPCSVVACGRDRIRAITGLPFIYVVAAAAIESGSRL